MRRPPRPSRLVLAAPFAMLAMLASASFACGGSKATPSQASDASADGAGTEGGAEGGTDGSPGGTCRTDVEHRPSADACPSHADAGAIEAGPGTCGQTLVPSDACLVDGDCAGAHGASGVCVCQSPGGQGCGVPPVTGNACVSASCHVDSDCPACGRCRVEQSCGAVTGYYCESPADECSTNADCGTGFCTFQGDHFVCRNDIACAG